eukprot:4651965-Prymnesium_polylepis.1
MALSEAAKEGVFQRRFLDELGLGSAAPTSLATDNKAARDLPGLQPGAPREDQAHREAPLL